MSLLDRFFQSREVKAVLAELRLIEAKLESESRSPAGTGYEFVKSAIWTAIRDNQAMVTTRIRSGDMTPRALVYTLMLNSFRREIASGRNHTYRGVLSMTGQGMLASFTWLLKQEELEGFSEHEDVAFAMDQIRQQIKEAG